MEVVGVCYWITTRCNLRCNICYADLNSIKDNDIDGYLKIIHRLADFGVKKIAFTGGEPLLVKGVETLLKEAKKKGIKVALTTNAILMNEKRIYSLEGCIDEMSVPMDGLENITSEIHRTNKHNHENVKSIIKLSSNLDIKLDVSTVLTSKNIDEIESVLDFLENNKIYKWKVFQYSELDKPQGMDIDFNISVNDFQNVISRIKRKIEYYNYKIEVDFRSNDEKSINSYVNVLPNGKLLLSENNEYIDVGNIFDFDNTVELAEQLVSKGFSFEEHHRRHFRDHFKCT